MAFKEKVYRVVKKIPKGKVLTYKEVAKLAGSPWAFHAVGNILNKNPDLKTIPCHRVIKSDGTIGGYRFGTKKKAALLKKEGVVIKRGELFINNPSKINERKERINLGRRQKCVEHLE